MAGYRLKFEKHHYAAAAAITAVAAAAAFLTVYPVETSGSEPQNLDAEFTVNEHGVTPFRIEASQGEKIGFTNNRTETVTVDYRTGSKKFQVKPGETHSLEASSGGYIDVKSESRSSTIQLFIE